MNGSGQVYEAGLVELLREIVHGTGSGAGWYTLLDSLGQCGVYWSVNWKSIKQHGADGSPLAASMEITKHELVMEYPTEQFAEKAGNSYRVELDGDDLGRLLELGARLMLGWIERTGVVA